MRSVAAKADTPEGIMQLSTGQDRPGLAVAVLLLTTLALSFADALIKGSAGQVGLWQMFVVRSGLALPAFVALILLRRLRRVWPGAPGWVVLRVVLLVTMWVAYYAALVHLPLAVAAAAYYTLPIFIMLFSALLLGERPGVRGWLAAGVGFAGVIVILRPGPEGVNWYVFLPLISAVCYALAMILTRVKCRDEPPLVLGLWLAVGFAVVGALGCAAVVATGGTGGFLRAAWMPAGALNWGVMAVLALALVAGSVGAAIAYQNGRPSVLGVFDFSYVAYAVIWGAVLFSEMPQSLTLAGIAMIVGAGMLAIWRSE